MTDLAATDRLGTVPTERPKAREDGLLIRQLPRHMAADPFLQRFVGIFEEIVRGLRQGVASTESLADPATVPQAYLHWLSSWQAMSPPATLPVLEHRTLISRGGQLNMQRGTAAGLRAYVESLINGPAEVEDFGGVFDSVDDAPPENHTVTVRIASTGAIEEDALRRLVAAQLPATAVLRLERSPGG